MVDLGSSTRKYENSSLPSMVIVPDLQRLDFQGWVEIKVDVLQPTSTVTTHSL